MFGTMTAVAIVGGLLAAGAERHLPRTQSSQTPRADSQLAIVGRHLFEEVRQGGHNDFDWLLHEVQGPARNQGSNQITLKNGQPATQGACQVCDTNIFKIGAAK